jgi:LuxR family maltose regulon positive regulatory protein
MPTQHRDIITGRLAAGSALLRQGRWAEAADFFAAAVDEHETPDALEGSSWAAWWLDDARTMFAARRRAYQLYRRNEDARAAARMAIWLASDELDFNGAAAVANGWLRRARRLLDPLEPGPEHGWLAFLVGYIAHCRGDSGRAVELADYTAQIGRRLGVEDLEMLGMALEGATRVACADVECGMRCLDEATAAALEDDAALPIAGAWTCCFMVTACTAVRDHRRASEWCDRIAAFAQRYGSRYMRAFCGAEYGTVHLWQGRWTEAEAVLEASIEDFSRSRPAMVGAPLVGLAELRRRQGRPAEAALLLDRAGASSAAQVCRARLALDRGDSRSAAELLERVLRQLPPRRWLDRVPVLESLAHARIACDDPGTARAALHDLREVQRLVRTPALRASADLAGGMLAAALQDHHRARTLLEDAVDRFVASGAPFEAAQARIRLAATLTALGRIEDARQEAAAGREAMLELGAVVEAHAARELLERATPEALRRDRAATAGLTPRELDVLRLLAEGLTNRQIADRLVISEHTVHRHVTNLMRKLGLRSRAAAAARAVSAGLSEPTDE